MPCGNLDKHQNARKILFILTPSNFVQLMSLKRSNGSRTRKIHRRKSLKESPSNQTFHSAITITHPHVYAEESLKGPVIVETIEQAFESARYQPLMGSQRSISLSSIPDLVLWAGQEAMRTRVSMRGSLKDDRSDFICSENQNLSVGAVAVSTPTLVTPTPTSAASDCFKALPDIPKDISDMPLPPSMSSYRPLSLQIPVKRSYSFSLSSARGTSFVSSRPSRSRKRSSIKGGKSLLRRFVIAWKRVTGSTRLKRKRDGKMDSKRMSMRLPLGFELVDPKQSSWWRSNSTSRRRRSGLAHQSMPVIDISAT